jgi:hypothetical protein
MDNDRLLELLRAGGARLGDVAACDLDARV